MMSGKSLLLLQRSLAGAKRLPACFRSGGGVPPVRTLASRAVCLRALRPLLPAGTRWQPRFFSNKGGDQEAYPPLPAYDQQESREVFIVQVRGLPWSCTVHELLHFFSDCRIRDGERGVHLTLDRLGRPSGRAFIEMEHEEDVSKALEKHRQYLGPRYVEVSEVTNSDAETILQHVAPPAAEDGVVMLRGLPFSCTQDDILLFFSGLDVVENGITMVTDGRGRNSGEAFVQFTSQEVAGKALQKHRELMGHRYVEVFPSRSSEIRSTWKRRSSLPPQSASPPAGRPASAPHRAVSPQSSEANSHFIHMRGLPFQASGEDIVKFFSPYVVSKIMIECRPDGRTSGEADVYFSCHRDAVAAMSRDRTNMGHRYIELFLNSAPDSDQC
ncbi:heterogeneous nuclear ribonucleoprotein H2 [Oryzias latipes]|uniref:G-rich RNA sequence binding factor 1 n=1 Tax=Oryzias latipes TaxID=8090 RepID=A0A3B3I3C4_ORYLA|nr:heterogeneous nuclear ribonucleoprotein H2 [Oryzias latipes]